MPEWQLTQELFLRTSEPRCEDAGAALGKRRIAAMTEIRKIGTIFSIM